MMMSLHYRRFLTMRKEHSPSAAREDYAQSRPSRSVQARGFYVFAATAAANGWRKSGAAGIGSPAQVNPKQNGL